ncbi:hypothetical protein ACFSWE_15465 [Leucobacter albus]|uniref:Uncharacterized protein n=1 Tax=Leucobacter albus TaxID=272210 RepID=A0ABW3TUV6_9MICO
MTAVSIIAIVAGVAILATLLVFGVIGVGRTVVAGSETQLCGARVGVVVADDASVRLLGTDAGRLAVGDRARIGAFCVVEVVGISESGTNTAPGEDVDGGGASVQLRWRLW